MSLAFLLCFSRDPGADEASTIADSSAAGRRRLNRGDETRLPDDAGTAGTVLPGPAVGGRIPCNLTDLPSVERLDWAVATER